MKLTAPFGIVPDDWEVVTLGDACSRGGGDIQTGPFGSQLHASDYVEAGIPSIMPQNIGDNRIVTDNIALITVDDAGRLSRYRVREGDIVCSRRGDVEKRALVTSEEDGWLCGTGCLRIRFGSARVDPRYASYYLGHPEVRSWIVRHAIGATMPNLSTSILSAMPFVVPPVAAQAMIADVLGPLDDKIEVNRRISETLEEIARALFKSWFVDFDPVRGTATVPADIRRLFPDRLVDSAIGPVPERWEVGTVGGVAAVNAQTAKAADLPATISYVDISSAANGGVPTAVELALTSAPSRARRLVSHGDTILSTVRPERRAHFLSLHPPSNLVVSTGFATLTPTRVPWSYLFCAVCRPSVFDALGQLASGGAYPAIRPAVVADLPLLVPDVDLLSLFHAIVAPMFEQRAALGIESATLAELRDTLLPKLISGTIRLETAS